MSEQSDEFEEVYPEDIKDETYGPGEFPSSVLRARVL